MLLHLLVHIVLSTAVSSLSLAYLAPLSSPTTSYTSIRHVLVIGSDGLIGSALTSHLHSHHVHVLHVHNRRHIDLRQQHALSVFDGENIDFAFFLACEVGGSKFLEAREDTQSEIIENNLKIYQTVLPYLSRRKIPFIFSSSYLQHLPASYGSIKRLGEAWVSNMKGIGKTVRFWNIYGRERTGAKAHVMTDWVQSCLTHQKINSLTDGQEWRQFTHANDTAAALYSMMMNFEHLEPVTDLAGEQWHNMTEVAELISFRSPHACQISLSHTPASHRDHILPATKSWWHRSVAWKPRVSLRQGIDDLYNYMMRVSLSNISSTSLEIAPTDTQPAPFVSLRQQHSDFLEACDFSYQALLRGG